MDIIRMAATDTSGGDESGTASACARDFIRDRLQEAGSPLSPAELAGEYGCTNGHVRNVLADLMDEGLAQRVGRGQYVDGSTEREGAGTDLLADMETDLGEGQGETTSDTGTDADGDDGVPSVDGEAPSEATDTPDEVDDQEGEPETTDEGQPEIEDEDMADWDAGEAAAAGVVGAGGMIPAALNSDADTDWVLYAVVAALALGVAYLWLQKRSEPEESGDGQQDTEEQSEAPSGGLLGETWEQ